MNEEHIRGLLESVRAGQVPPEAALQQLMSGPFRSGIIDFAHVDHHRRMRQGLGEVIYGEAKPIEQILAIATEASVNGTPVLITRLQPEKMDTLIFQFADGRANRVARTFLINAPVAVTLDTGLAHVAIVAAGTSDLPVAEEAAEVCVAMGIPCARYTDVGVAGIHRLLHRVDALQKATSLVVVAGMEGALPSVVAGMLGRPVFAVPTSVGYGAHLGGISALLTMLNSCAPGVSVVNIDNGFSAGYAACQVVRAVQRTLAATP
jgi:pyridinium-3,5-biscarboxylic acid mononucleotide synthase